MPSLARLPKSPIVFSIVASGPVREAFGWSELRLQSLARDEGVRIGLVDELGRVDTHHHELLGVPLVQLLQ